MKKNDSPSTIRQPFSSNVRNKFNKSPIISMGKNNPFQKKLFHFTSNIKDKQQNITLKPTTDSAVNRSFEGPEPMQIKDVYKQPLLLCTACRSPISYHSFIQEESEKSNSVKMSTMTNVKAEELIYNSIDFLPLSCPICSYTLGIKYVSLTGKRGFYGF